MLAEWEVTLSTEHPDTSSGGPGGREGEGGRVGKKMGEGGTVLFKYSMSQCCQFKFFLQLDVFVMYMLYVYLIIFVYNLVIYGCVRLKRLIVMTHLLK